MSTTHLYPPDELAFTEEERQDILHYRQKRITRKRKREGPDMPEEIDMSLRRYYKNYDTIWKNLKPTGRCNEGVGILRLPVCGTEKEYRFVYRGSAMHTIPVTTHHSEASNMRKYEELEKAGIFVHSRPPKVYFVKCENDGNRGSKDQPAVICEFFDGCTDAEGKLRVDEEFSVDGEGYAKNKNEHADADHSIYWSERKRKLYTRNHALAMIQLRLIQKSTISGGAENPMYDNMSSFANMGPRPEKGEDQAPNDRMIPGRDRSADFFERGRAEEVVEHRFRSGHYKSEKEWACECLKRELAYWSTMHEETYLAMKDYTKQVLRKYTFRIDKWFTKSNIVAYLTKYLRHIETSPWTFDNHRFRDNENQFLGLFSMSHQDLYMGNNMMMKGDKPGFLLDFETSTFSNLSNGAALDVLGPTTYANSALDPVAAGFATREHLVDDIFYRRLTAEHARRKNPGSCERKWPFSGEIAPFFDRYFRLTLLMQLEQFDGYDDGEDLQFQAGQGGGHMTIPSGRRYLSEAFERFGPALTREDFNHGDRYDTSVDDVERPEAPDYFPGMFYDSDEDEDNMEELDLQPAYDRLRAERRYLYGTGAYRRGQADRKERAEGAESEEEPPVPGLSEEEKAERNNRYKHSPFAEDWMNNCSYPLARRYLDDFIQNNPMAWFDDPATTFAARPINHPVAKNENFATWFDPWAEEEEELYPRDTQEYFDAGYNNYGPDPQQGHPTTRETLDINDTTQGARWADPLDQFEARRPALNAAYRLRIRANDLPREAPAANAPPESTATLDARNLSQWLS